MKKRKLYVEKVLDYGTTIDHTWLIVWGTIFCSFVVLDFIFQSQFAGENVFWDFNIFGQSFHLMVVYNGTFFGVTLIKYLGVVLSFLYAHQKFPKDYILQIALLFTLLADTLLTFDNVSLSGVFCFCLAQYFHLARFARVRPSFFMAWTGFLLLLLLLGRLLGIETMFILAFIYLISLATNLFFTHRWWSEVERNPKKYTDRDLVASTCAFFGFVLFCLCDLNVALSYLSVTGFLPFALARLANFFAWFFYYPSQILISNSSVITEKTQKKPKKVSKLKKSML